MLKEQVDSGFVPETICHLEQKSVGNFLGQQ